MNDRIKMLLSCLAVMLLCCVATVAVPPDNDAPTDRPADAPPRHHGGRERPSDASEHAEHRGRARGMGRALTDEQEAKLLEFLQEHMASRYEAIVGMSEENPERYARVMPRMWRWYQQWKDMSPEAQEASLVEHDRRVETFMILRRWRDAASPEEKEQVKAELQEALERHFDAEQALREVQLAELEQRLEQVRQEVQQRADDRDAIVAGHMQRMLQYRSRAHNAGAPDSDKPADTPSPPEPDGQADD